MMPPNARDYLQIQLQFYITLPNINFGSNYNSIQYFVMRHSMTFSKKTRTSTAKSTPRKAKYDVICLEKRKELINLVMRDQISIYKASRLTGINNATAKVIVKKYRETGLLFARKTEQDDLSLEIFKERSEFLSPEDYENQQFPQTSNQNEPAVDFSSILACPSMACYVSPVFYMYSYYYF